MRQVVKAILLIVFFCIMFGSLRACFEHNLKQALLEDITHELCKTVCPKKVTVQ